MMFNPVRAGFLELEKRPVWASLLYYHAFQCFPVLSMSDGQGEVETDFGLASIMLIW
jgi:hypothetical protein